jgi:Na+/H+ antiporter NhaC
MLSALMLRRVLPALRYAFSEEEFGPVFGAGILLVVVGSLTYTLSQDWNVVDSFYFSVSTLTTTSVSDPDLVLQEGWLKVFTVLYQLIGIGILVEILRRLGTAFITVRAREKSSHHRGDAPGSA